jgi:hypothetical protein
MPRYVLPNGVHLNYSVDKFEKIVIKDIDLEYIKNITLWGDINIIFKTAFKVFKREGIAEEGMATAADLGDYLLGKGSVTESEYAEKQKEAKELLNV